MAVQVGQTAPVVDGNVLRVLSRLFLIHDPINEEKTKDKMYVLQESLVPTKNPGVFNEALMEFGALICTPKNPNCSVCPLQKSCKAYQLKQVHLVPKKSKQVKISKVHAYAIILKNKDEVLIHRRPVGQIMGGLWEFPEWKMKEGVLPTPQSQSRALSHHLSLKNPKIRFVKSIKRHYTRFQETLNVYETEFTKSKKPVKAGWAQSWVRLEKIEDYPLTSAHAKIRSTLLESMI